MSVSIGAKTEVLIQALPYIQRYEGKTFVVKYGGAAMVEEELRDTFAQDVTLLRKIGINIVVVHGGGKEVTGIAGKLGIASRFIDGQRYTDQDMMDVVQMVLAGKTNKDIVLKINQHDGDAVGLSGIDGDLLRVIRHTQDGPDLGFVGTVRTVNTGFLKTLLQNGYLPVIAPVGADDHAQPHNINADNAAAAIASALQAEKLVYLSDVEGVLSAGTLVHTITRHQAERMISVGAIVDGMIPKIRSAFRALDSGVNKVHMIDGRTKHSLLLEIFTDEGVGTELVHDIEGSMMNQPA